MRGCMAFLLIVLPSTSLPRARIRVLIVPLVETGVRIVVARCSKPLVGCVAVVGLCVADTVGAANVVWLSCSVSVVIVDAACTAADGAAARATFRDAVCDTVESVEGDTTDTNSFGKEDNARCRICKSTPTLKQLTITMVATVTRLARRLIARTRSWQC